MLDISGLLAGAASAPSNLSAQPNEKRRPWASRRGAPDVQVDVCFLCLPAGFPPVPQYLDHDELYLCPCQNRTYVEHMVMGPGQVVSLQNEGGWQILLPIKIAP